MKPAVLLSLLVVLISLPIAAAEPKIEAWSFDRIELEVRIDAKTKSIEVRGDAVVRLDDESSHGPVFGLSDGDEVIRFRSLRAGDVRATLLPYDKEKEIALARLQFSKLFRRGDTLRVSFVCSGIKNANQFRVTSEGALASWVTSWYPRPLRSATELAPPAVAGSIRFVLPPGWRSISNGRVSADKGIETWTSDEPVARSFVAAPFAAVDHVTSKGRYVGYAVMKPRPRIGEQAAALADAIAAMEKEFGPFPFPSYTIVEVPEDVSFAAGSEQGFIMVRASMLDAERGNLPLFAHEAAHGWWGNLVRTRGTGAKLVSEALAQYGAVMSIEAIEGRAAMIEFLRHSRENYNPLQCALGYFHIWREGGDKPLAQLTSDRWDHNLSDSKAMWVYHMLRLRIGDAAFFGALRSLLRDFRGREASVDDLRAAMIAAAPADAGLPAFLAQWLDRTGAPVLRVDWWSRSQGKEIEVQVSQCEALAPFAFPLELEIATKGGGSVRHTIDVTQKMQSFVLPTPSRPVGLVLDPDDELLLWRNEYGPRPCV